MRRVLGIESQVHFQVNPLEGDNCPDLLHCIDDWQQSEGRSYTDMILYCMARLVQRGDIRPNEHLLERFPREIYPQIKDDLEQMYEV